MKRRVVMVLMTAMMMGTVMTGCGNKTDTAQDTVQEVVAEDSQEDADTEETAQAEEETEASAEETAEEEPELDEAALLESDIPEDPDETIAIIKKMKDYDIRYDYTMKANDKYLDENIEEVVDKWANGIGLYLSSILDKREIVDGDYYFGVDYDHDSPEAALLQEDIPEDPQEAMDVVNSIQDPNIRYTYFEKASYYFCTQDQSVYDKWLDAEMPYMEEIYNAVSE